MQETFVAAAVAEFLIAKQQPDIKEIFDDLNCQSELDGQVLILRSDNAPLSLYLLSRWERICWDEISFEVLLIHPRGAANLSSLRPR